MAQPAEKDCGPYAVSHLGWGMNPQALWYGIALDSRTIIERGKLVDPKMVVPRVRR